MTRPAAGRSTAQLLADFGHELPPLAPASKPAKDARLFGTAPTGGPRRPGRGWAPTSAPVSRWRMTSDQAACLWPLIATPALPPTGAQLGIDELSGGCFYADPLGWVLDEAVPVTNPNVMSYGKPGGGKSADPKAFITAMFDFGYKALILGDVKDEYEPLCHAHGVEPFRVGPGLPTRLNPLDLGPLGDGWATLDRAEIHRRAALLFPRWLGLIRGLVSSQFIGEQRVPFSPSDALVVETALKQLTGYTAGQHTLQVTTLPRLWASLNNPTPELIGQCRYASERQFLDETRLVRDALAQLCSGALAGMFDDHTTFTVDWAAPIQSLSLSRLEPLGDEATGIALACVSSWGRGMREVKEAGELRVSIRDEVWMQMRLGLAAVQNLDADLRLSRRDGEINWMIGHKPGDSAGAGNTGTAARAIASELLALADIKILHGQEARVADELRALIGFSPLVHDLITGWATQRPGRAIWCVGPRLYKVQTILHPLVKALCFTNQALEGAA